MLNAIDDLLDVNVWLAFAVSGHAQHGVAVKAWSQLTRPTFCRVTQLGLVRLLCNRQVMGNDALEPGEAWSLYEQLIESGAVYFAEEPANLETSLKPMLIGAKAARDFWTDAYLAAFATNKNMRLVSFDGGFSRFKGLNNLILSSDN
jgi:toxin-antitoxin system PIN domain toxin